MSAFHTGGVLEVSLLGWFFAVVVIVALQMFGGGIALNGLLAPERKKPGQGAHLHRAQLLVTTVGFAATYLVQALHQAPGQPMPDVSKVMLVALTGSQGLYLGGKAANG